eukprot:TRINITY_DN13574_c0_g1_i3.p2 TRINITY_DN13574_c0_g1~~TRINITY_DN13574_c0_g1_i3.p2  ORF type:complete len:104 (-),score=28.73 TRINITY_DN13574_c0_g1_i3:116-427(-)
MVLFFFLMIRRPPRSTQGVSSAASDVYKRQAPYSSSLFCSCDNLLGEFFGRFFDMSSGELTGFSLGESLGISFGESFGISLGCLLYTSPSPRDLSTSRMPSSA